MNRLKKMRIECLWVFLCALVFSCQPSTETTSQTKTTANTQNFELSEQFKQHWFDGKAEVASYALTQMRYGEAREGQAVLIFVKEPFLPNEQVKANSARTKTIDVMKLNLTKKFTTGIYPYSIMQSTFSPLYVNEHAVKVSASTQEWCGQTYMQLNNKEKFEIKSHSYFEGEADQRISLNQTTLENDIWNKLRINPTKIKTGAQKLIPDFSFIRLKHIPVKAYQAEVVQQNNQDTLVTKIAYKDLDRVLNIYQSAAFPFEILKWEEKTSELDKNFTKAVLQKYMRIDYWNKNSSKFVFLRDSLQLN